MAPRAGAGIAAGTSRVAGVSTSLSAAHRDELRRVGPELRVLLARLDRA